MQQQAHPLQNLTKTQTQVWFPRVRYFILASERQYQLENQMN